MRVRQPAGADAVPRRRRRHAAAAQPARVRRAARVQLPFRDARPRALARGPAGPDLGDGRRPRAGRGAALRRCTRAPASSATCARSSRDPDRTDDFRLLEHELYLAATDLDTCERIVFGADGLGRRADLDAPCAPRPRCRWSTSPSRSRTASWSTAASSRRRTSTSPSRRGRSSSSSSTRSSRTSTTSRSRSRRCSARACGACRDMGFPQIGYQTFKLLAYQRLHEIARQWEQRYPGVDIVLIEPEPDDELMFQTSDHELRLAGRHRPPRLPVGDAEARRGLRPLQGDLRAPRHRDLGHARAQGRQALRRREGAARAPGARSSSRRPARCCASRPPSATQAAAERAMRSALRARRSARRRGSGSSRARGRRRRRAAPGARARRCGAAAPRARRRSGPVRAATARWPGSGRRRPAASAQRVEQPRALDDDRSRARARPAPAQRAQRLQRAGLRELGRRRAAGASRRSSASVPGPPSA